MSLRDLEEFAKREAERMNRVDVLEQSLARGAQENPDDYAKALSLAGKTGVSPGWAQEFRPEIERKQKTAPASIYEIVRRAPRTAQFLADQDNAAVAHDEIPNLQKHESLLESIAGFGSNALRSLGAAPGRALAGFAGVTRAGAEAAGTLLDPLLDIQRGLTGLEVRNPIFDLAARFGQAQRIYEAGAAQTRGDLSQSSPFAQSVYSGIESAGQTMLTMPLAIATGNPWLSLAPMGAQTTGQAYGQARDAGLSIGQALPFALSQGAIEVATERLPAVKLLQGLGLNHGIRGAARLFGSQLVTENWTEQVATALQDLNEWALLPENKDKTFGDYWDERPNAALQTFIATTTGTLLQTGAAKTVDTAVNRAERQQQRLFFEALGESATASKLRQRLPEKYREFVEQTTKDGPVQDVLIPADQFITYFQTQEMNPDVVARELNARNYHEALLSGADVRIPLADFAEKIAATPHLRGLQDDLRLRPDRLTEREARDAQERDEAADNATIERMRQIVEEQGATRPLDTAVELVTANVQAQLEAAGMKAETARDQATVMRGAAVLAHRAYPDMDPLQAAMRMWERYGMKIQAPNLGAPVRAETTRFFQPGGEFDNESPMPRKGGPGQEPTGTQAPEPEGGIKPRQFKRPIWADEFEAIGGTIHADGTIDLYHATTKEKAAQILRDGVLKRPGDAPDSYGVYFSSSPEVAEDYGDGTLVRVRVRVEDLSPDDAFPGRRLDFTAPTRRGAYKPVSILPFEPSSPPSGGGQNLSASEHVKKFFQADLTRDRPPQIEFEVNPGSSDESLKSAWEALPIESQSKITQSVAGEFAPLVLDEAGTTGELFNQIGGWEGATAPSVALTVHDPDRAIAAGKLLGYVLSQDAVFVISKSPAPGLSETGAVQIALPDGYGIEQVRALYDKLYELEKDEQKLVIGHSTSGNEMLIVNTTGVVGTDELGQVISDHLNGEFEVSGYEVYTALLERGDDNYGLQTSRSRSRKQSAESRRAGNLRQKAIRAVQEAIRRESGGGQQFFAGEPGDKRASIEFGPDRQVTISLLENRNLSSFLHEAGHFYLEALADLAADADTAQQVKDDYATILKFVGKESREQVTTEDHEKIARAFEQYLREGKAPSTGLVGVFQRFRAWLTFIYKSAKDLRVTLNDEVREVFDRMLATDEEIFRARQDLGESPMITTPELVGWTREQFDLYAKAVADEVEQGKETLQNRLMAEYARAQKKAYREEFARVRREVEEKSALMPVYLAFNALGKGEMMGGDPAKLNRKAIVDRYGEGVLKTLPRSVYADGGNIDAETGAAFFGFASGDDLVKALAEMVPQSRYINAEARRIMAERHGDILVDGTIANRAMAALHNEKRVEVMRMELRALRGKLDEVSPLLRPLKEEIKQGEKERAQENRWRDAEEAARFQQARQATETAPESYYRNLARLTIEAASARQIQPQNYVFAGRKASRLAFEAMAMGDYVEAAIQKQRELTNHYLYLEASKAREEIDAIVKFAKRFDTTAVREAMGKAQIGGGTYLDQIDAILNRYEFRKVPIVQLERRESLVQWVDSARAAGYDPVIDDALLNEARKVNYQSVPLTELRAVNDALKNIEHLARLKNRLAYANKQFDFAEATGELRGAAEQNIGLTQQLYSESARPLTERAKQVLAGLDAGIIRMETLINWLDGDNVNGPWHRYIWNPLKAAQHELNDEAKAITGKIDKLYKSMPRAWRHGLLDRVRVQGIAETITRKDLIGYALNLGNAQNREKLTAGNFNGDSAVVARIQQRLTAEDWRFVQEIWAIIDSLWPKINAVQKRLTGVDMKKVESVPFVAFDAQGNEVAKLKGGYYPLVADRKRSTVGLRQEGDLFEETYISTSTSHGFTKDRTGAKYPLDPNFERILGAHLAQVMKDFTHREAVLAVNKILIDTDMRQVLTSALGEKYEPLFRAWLKDIANDTNRSIADGMEQWSRAFTATRANVVAAVMGFKATTMLSQFVSLSGSLDRVGAKYLGKSLLDYVRHPIATTRQVFEQSGEMRHRANNLDRDIRARLRMLVGKQTVLADVQRVAFHGIAAADSMVAVITWHGAYDQALAAGKDAETAKLEADMAVRVTQGAGEIMDQSAVQRNRGEFWRAVTMFYSFYNAQYSQGRDIGFQVDGAGDLPRALARAFLVFIMPAITADIILGRAGGDDDDEPGYLGWAVRKALLSPLATVPLLRDVGQWLESGYDIRFTPIGDVLTKMQRLGRRATKDATDDREIDFARYAAEVAEIAAYVFGVPGAAQIRASGSYISRWAEGEEEPDNWLAGAYRAVVGKRKEK